MRPPTTFEKPYIPYTKSLLWPKFIKFQLIFMEIVLVESEATLTNNKSGEKNGIKFKTKSWSHLEAYGSSSAHVAFFI